ncbi:MAG: EthD domain-containing protein [Solirubrobacterales bacterium]|nr:EthD domain-containing protein [Solirubrobacterales bacterium]MBV9717442.1 EthD domain-containing protein [Solirubrobacterales bacterium]
MYKVVWIARYTKDKTKQEASNYWARHHGPAMKKVSPLAGYVQSHVQGPLPLVSGVAEEDTFFDGYSCAWWNDQADFEQAMTTSEWQVVVDDGANVFDMDWLWNMSAQIEEHPMIEGPSSPYKVVWIVRFKEGMSREHGREYWRGTHGPIFKKLDIDRYVQNHVVGPIGAEGETQNAEIGFDGFSECWFRDERQFLNAVESDTWAVAVEDAQNVFDMTEMWGAVLNENVVVAPQLART